MRVVVLTVFLLWSAHVQAQAGRDLAAELTSANSALARRDYATAYGEFARHADRNGLAQFTLGLIEQQGWGRPVNPVVACDWFERAALQRIPAGQQLFGDCLARGIGRPVDGAAAIVWYKAAAAAGVSYALCSAAELYIEGKLVPQDVDQGLALCAAAAQAESPPAMLRLARYYSEGGAVPPNLPLARYWFDQAAQRRQPEAQFRLGVMLSEGRGGEPDLGRARFWLEHAAAEGYAPAYLATAILYANAPPDPATGTITAEDLAKVYMWNQAARARTHNPVQLSQIDRIDALVARIMPPQWKPELDRKVAAHLAAYPSAPPGPAH